MLPNRCSIKEGPRQCPNPPEFIVTITSDNDSANGKGTEEYMLGVTCNKHRQRILAEVRRRQDAGVMMSGRVGFTPVKSVGTDCIRGDPDDLVQIDNKTDIPS